jgi:hypothetical protein
MLAPPSPAFPNPGWRQWTTVVFGRKGWIKLMLKIKNLNVHSIGQFSQAQERPKTPKLCLVLKVKAAHNEPPSSHSFS